tara:strand:+ start:101 stop:478 length:378 start_codon:yes stop_codon:yes gene_type:complete
MKRIIISFLILFGLNNCIGQEMLNSDNFKSKIAKNIVAVEFWASWNSANEFKELSKLKDCKVYRIDISMYMDVQSMYNVSAIPTVIIFESGEEKERFNANVMFKLDADKKTVQHSIDTLMLNKFN